MGKILIVNHTEVRKWLPMQDCIGVMANVLKMLALETASNPVRQAMWLPDRRGLLGMMPACLHNDHVMGLKALSVFFGNQETGHDSHQGAVLLFDAEQGRLLAVMDASAITAIRTAAVSALATKLLAKPDAGDLAILGSGVQAHAHLEAMLAVRDIHRIRVWSRNMDHCEVFARTTSRRHAVTVEPKKTAEEAVAGANIICTVTAATNPVLMGHWLTPGCHINAVGACVKNMRELDTAAVLKSKLFVDRRESALEEAGDLLIPIKERAMSANHIQDEIGEILLGQIDGRKDEEEITLFESLGLAVEDVASADHIYRKMTENKVGSWIDF